MIAAAIARHASSTKTIERFVIVIVLAVIANVVLSIDLQQVVIGNETRILLLICNLNIQMAKIIKQCGKISLAANVCDLERTLLGGQSFR